MPEGQGANPLACPVHPTRAAGCACTRCKRRLCEECIGEERAGRIICKECWAPQIADDQRDEEARTAAAIAEGVEAVRPRARTLLLRAGIMALALELGFMLIVQPVIIATEKPPWTRGGPAPRTSRGWECVRRIFAARLAIDRYQAENGKLPEKIEDADPAFAPCCPSSGKPFVYTTAGQGSIACPDAGEHGVVAIRAPLPGCPTEIVRPPWWRPGMAADGAKPPAADGGKK